MSEKAATDDWIERKRGYCLAILNADDSKLDELMRPPKRSKLEAREYLSLIARIDALQAENKRLRGLCVECRTQLSTTLTLAMLLLPFADEKITDETYNQCVAELQKSRELLDSASKETI